MRRQVQAPASALVSLLLLCAAACSPAPPYEAQRGQAAESLAATIGTRGVGTVAVLDFASLDDHFDDLGRFLALDLATDLKAQAADFTLCERDGVGELLAEIDFEKSGLVTQDQVADLGKGCGAEGVVWGRYSVRGSRIVLNVKLLSVESHEVLGTARLVFPKSPDFEELVGSNVRKTGSAAAGHSTAPERNLPQTVRAGALEVTLRECTFRESNLYCELPIANVSSQTAQVEVLPTSALYDNQSALHRPLRVWLDGQPSFLVQEDRPAVTTLAAGKSVRLELVFDSVPRAKKKAELLQIDLQDAGPARFWDFAFDRD